MPTSINPFVRRLAVVALVGAPLISARVARAQDRLTSMHGYEQYARMAPKRTGAIKSGAVTPQWADDGRSFEFTQGSKRSSICE